jgi:LCP family protein required for cell wall assembly
MTADKSAANAAGGDKPPDPAAPHGANYLAARRRFQRHIAVSARARRQRLLLAALGGMSVVTLLVSGSAWLATGYISSGFGRLNAGTSGTPADGPVNILVAGVDTRSGLTRGQQLRLHVGDVGGTNTDTMMLVHIPADHQSVQVVSLPRDSWVNIPGHGMNKINAAFALGGPPLMVSTVERATGLTINDYAEINFLGFVRVIDELGGVNVCLPFAVDDPQSGLHLSAGRHHVNGATALKFARDRHSFVTSDLARIGDQQQLMSSLLAQATASGLLVNPVRMQRVLSSVTASVTVDQGFNATELAGELRSIKTADVSFTTVPIVTADYRTPTGESAVLWDQAAAAGLFRELKADKGIPRRTHGSRPPGRRPSPVQAGPASAVPRTAAQNACR